MEHICDRVFVTCKMFLLSALIGLEVESVLACYLLSCLVLSFVGNCRAGLLLPGLLLSVRCGWLWRNLVLGHREIYLYRRGGLLGGGW